MRRGSTGLATFANRAVTTLALLGAGVIVATALLVVFDGAMRAFFRSPQSWVADLREVALPVAVSAFMPFALLGQHMIRIPALGSLLPGKAWILDLLGAFVLFLVIFLVSVMIGRYAIDLMQSGQKTWLLRLPLWPTWAIVCGLWGLASLAQLHVFVCSLPTRGAGERTSR